MKSKFYLLFIFNILSCFLSDAQDKSNRGKEFWLGYGFNGQFFPTSGVPTPNSQEMAIYISTEQAATVTVSVNSTSWSQTLNIPANTVNASILIPKTGANDARILTDGLSTKGIHILSDVPVAVYAHQYASQFSAATMLMPVETYGFSYYSINYSQKLGTSPLPTINNTSYNWENWYCWFFVIASEDNTRLEITPSDTTQNGWLPGQTYTVNLNKGEMYNVFGKAFYTGSAISDTINSSKDLTGSKVVSVPGADGFCHPVGMFSGSGGFHICRGDGGEAMQQQVFPAQAWGTRYLTYHTINNTSTNITQTNRNYYRVSVQDPTAVVKRNGVTLTGLIKNFYYELTDSTGGDYITSDKPILVSQYTPNKNQCWNYPISTPAPPTYGDPEMFYLSPIEQGQKSVLFYTSRKSSIDYVYANIHLPTAAIGSLRVDGAVLPAAQIIPHPNYPSYSVALARFTGPAAQHTISADSAFTSTVYGLGNFESYGYNVGTLINNLNNYSQIKNVFSTINGPDSFTCPKTPTRLYIKLAYPASSITWKLSQVPGILPNTDSIINSPIPINTEQINGRTYYTYSLQQDFTFAFADTFYIPITYAATVIQNCNQSENAVLKVIVKPGPVADFSISNVNCLKDTVFFTGTSNSNSFNINSYLWNFDDASTQNTVNAKKKFATAGNQNIRYRIYADNGCAGDTIKTINIFPEPISKIGASSPACASDSVLISDTSSIVTGTITSWQYDFGDGNSQIRTTNTPFNHGYNLPGTYIIKLITVSNNSCKSDTAYKSVTVFAKPTAKFGYNNNICLPDSLHITDTSSIASGTITSWQYNFGDGNTLVKNNNTAFYHNYTAAGTYTVWLVTTSNMGCKSDTFRRTVTVGAKPLADFSISNVTCLKDTVFFNHVPPGAFTISSYTWNFDDGSTQTTIDAKKKFATAGNQTIRYRVYADNGCVGDTSKLINLLPSPIAKLGAASPACNVDSVLVSDTSSITSGTITSWYYDFGDGNTTTRNNNTAFYHKYTTAGNYTIMLITTSALGCKSDTSKRVISITSKPVVSFTYSGNPCVNNTITFTSNYTNGSNTSWYWQFGDGQTFNTSSGNTATHLYTSPLSNIIVKHLVSIGGCSSDTAYTTIPLINPSPVASFVIKKDTICENKPILFSSSLTGISSWNWDFGNGTGSSAPPFLKTYTTAGNYTISLVVTDVNGCNSLPATDVLLVNPSPIVNAGVDKFIQTGSSVLLNASVTPPATYTYLWTPSTGLSATNILQPVAAPAVTTTYSLKVDNPSSHCFSKDSVVVAVISKLYIPNAFSPNGDGLNDKWNIPGMALYPDAVVTIYNRYGEKVYEITKNYFRAPWDGTFKNSQQPIGAFIYTIKLNDPKNQSFTGTVTIVR